MSVTYQIEPWSSELSEEMMPLWVAHWLEVGMDHEAVPLDPDFEAIWTEALANRLRILTVRKDGNLVGYHISKILRPWHYKSTLCAFVDAYYLAESHRKGFAGVRMFKEAERDLASIGVKKMYSFCKLGHDHGRIFERLGYVESEREFTKVIGE